MTYRIKTRNPAPYVPIEASDDVSLSQMKAVRKEAYLKGRLVGIGMARIEGHKNKFGGPISHETQKILISSSPFETVFENLSWVEDAKAHAVVVNAEGQMFGLMSCTPRERGQLRHGTLLADAYGRGWFVPEDEGAEPEPIMLCVPPHVREFDLMNVDLADILPCSARVRIEGQVVTSVSEGPATDITKAEARVAAKVAREDVIAKIVTDTLTQTAFNEVLDTLSFPTEDGVFPSHSSKFRDAFDDAFLNMTRRVLIGLRDAGLCAPCPNNGPRGVQEMTLWNTFLTGVADEEPGRDAPFGHMTAYNWAMMIPPFKAFSSVLIMTSFDAENRAWAEKNDGAKRPYDVRVPFTREGAELLYGDFMSEILNVMRGEEAPLSLSDGMESRNDRKRLGLAGSFLTPVLCELLDRTRTPLPVMETPTEVRHLTISLPSGRLVMADWFRIPGFTEGMEEMSGEEKAGFDINKAQGLDERMRAYYEKAGVVIVQVGNTSPYAYADGEGIWRLGHVDEDAFWDEDGDKIADVPKPIWTTCTDLWANTFASPEAIVNVLMSSGKYVDEAEAERALLDYCEESYGANLIDLGVETLHVYAPTGFAVQQTRQMTGVGSGEISQDEWREDAYILSDRELSVEPKKLATDAWTEFRSAEAETIPSP